MSKKRCEMCEAEIPDDYVNLLCDKCYQIAARQTEKAIQLKEEEETEKMKKDIKAPTNVKNVSSHEPISIKEEPQEPKIAPQSTKADTFGIKDPNYKSNPEMDDKDQVLANLAQFIYSHDPAKKRKGKMLWYPTRNMYTYIKNYCILKVQEHPQYPKHIWKPRIVDVGCGSGVGSNIMSQEADFVWGIDKNEWSIEFAQECFTRVKNGIYYNPQLTFDVIDILEDSREFMKFDMVVAIEIIEHIYDTDRFLKSLIQFTKRDKAGKPIKDFPTEFFISTPNRNSPKIKDDKPENPYHVRELTSQEFYDLLSQYFEKVKLLDNKGQPVKKDCKDDLVLAHCGIPKI